MLVAQLCPTLCNPWPVSHQAPLSMEFSRREYWIELPFPSPGPGLTTLSLKWGHRPAQLPGRLGCTVPLETPQDQERLRPGSACPGPRTSDPRPFGVQGTTAPPPSSHKKPTSRGRAIGWGDGGMEMEGQRPLTWLLQEKNERVLDGLRLGVQGNQRRHTRME